MDKEDQKLLLSVCNGLGTYVVDERGNKIYKKDDDCLGERVICVPWTDLLEHPNMAVTQLRDCDPRLIIARDS